MTSPDLAKENVERLIVLTERLTERLAVDAKAFEDRKPHEAAARLEETSRLANLYRYESVRVRQDPSMVAGAPLELRKRLTVVTEGFESVLARHGRALFAAKTVTEGVVRSIAEEVVKARTVGAAYGPRPNRQDTSGVAITLNRQA